jgi:hypothetical protein
MPSMSSNIMKNTYDECLEKCSSNNKTRKNNDCTEICNIYRNEKNNSKSKLEGTRCGYGTLRGLMRNL